MPRCAYLQVIARRPREAGEAEPGRPQPTTTGAASDVRAFANACVHARSVYVHYKAIFEETPFTQNPLKNRRISLKNGDVQPLREILLLILCRCSDKPSLTLFLIVVITAPRSRR